MSGPVEMLETRTMFSTADVRAAVGTIETHLSMLNQSIVSLENIYRTNLQQVESEVSIFSKAQTEPLILGIRGAYKVDMPALQKDMATAKLLLTADMNRVISDWKLTEKHPTNLAAELKLENDEGRMNDQASVSYPIVSGDESAFENTIEIGFTTVANAFPIDATVAYQVKNFNEQFSAAGTAFSNVCSALTYDDSGSLFYAIDPGAG